MMRTSSDIQSHIGLLNISVRDVCDLSRIPDDVSAENGFPILQVDTVELSLRRTRNWLRSTKLLRIPEDSI